MRNRWKLALALLLLILGLVRVWEALSGWQAQEPWAVGAILSVVYLIAAGLIWRESRGRA